MSTSTAQPSAAASPPPRPSGAGPAQIRRATSPRLYAALALGSLLFGALSLLYPSTPSYDPWGWLLWGREILHLNLNTVGANTFKPLPVVLTLPFALLGHAQADLWLVVARGGMVFALAMAFRLAARIVVWFGAAADGRQGWARLQAYAPAALAGAVAAGTMLISPEYIRNGSLGYSECLSTGLVLLAFDRHLDDRPRQTFIIGFFPALDRPEVWAFWGLYGLYLWFRDPGARKLILALFVLIPICWFAPEYWGSGSFFRGVQHDLHPTAGAPAYAKCPFCTEMKDAVYISLLRTTIIAAVLALGTSLVIWRALRVRTTSLAVAVREQIRQPEGVVLSLAVLASLWFLEVSAMTQYGFSGNQRYMIIGGAPVMVIGGVTVGLVARWLGRQLGRLLRPAPGALVGLAAAAAAFLFIPSWAGANFHPHALNRALRYQAELRQDLKAVIRRAGGPHAINACGKVETENFQVPMVAWYLGVTSVTISDEMPPAYAATHANVIFQTRDTGTASLRPLIPAGVRYRVITQRTFRLYEHCR